MTVLLVYCQYRAVRAQVGSGQSIDSEENGVDRNTTLVVLGGRQADADIPTSEIGKYAEVYAWNKYSRTNRAYRKGYGDVFMS